MSNKQNFFLLSETREIQYEFLNAFFGKEVKLDFQVGINTKKRLILNKTLVLIWFFDNLQTSYRMGKIIAYRACDNVLMIFNTLNESTIQLLGKYINDAKNAKVKNGLIVFQNVLDDRFNQIKNKYENDVFKFVQVSKDLIIKEFEKFIQKIN